MTAAHIIKIKRLGLFFCGLVLVAAAPAFALDIDTRRVVLDENTPSSSLTITNNTGAMETYDLSWQDFVMAPDGTLTEKPGGESTGREANWAQDSVRFVPSQVILLPGKSARILLAARPAETPGDAEHRRHLLITGEESGQSIALPVFFRTGTPQAGAAISNATATLDNDALAVTLTLARSGEASLYGAIEIKSCGDLGAMLHREEGVALYTDIENRVLSYRTKNIPGDQSCTEIGITYRAPDGTVLAETTAALGQ